MKIEYLGLPGNEQELIFRETGQRLGMNPALVEKDFWVCWMLQTLFEFSDISENLVFKGGTSLSKVFKVINRFSEDIDVGLTPAYLGISEEIVETADSRSQRTQWMSRMQEQCGIAIQERILEGLESAVAQVLGPRPNGATWLQYMMDHATHSPVVLFHYPDGNIPGMDYIQKSVKLEFGSLTDQKPVGKHPIEPWVAQVFPQEFRDWRCEVTALEIERTFWEKATILHAAFNRPIIKPMRDRYARHYSDFASLWRHEHREVCLNRLDLLERVARHKHRYFGSSWAGYENAKPGLLRLSPPKGRIGELTRDYEKMEGMFTSNPPPFENVLAAIAEAEQRINTL